MDYQVSFLMMCYKQERFVRDSVRSVLAQDLAGIEIIISDDCSPDRTYNILQEECRRYSGPNHVIIRRTKKNLGINSHMTELVGMAKGRLIVLGAGDDIARKDKASMIFNRWNSTNALVFGCCPEVIDEQGQVIGSFYSAGIPEKFTCRAIIKRRNAGIFISGFDREIFDMFGPLGEGATEDQVIPFRGALMCENGVDIIKEPLVLYRAHPESQVTALRFAKEKRPLEVLRSKIITSMLLYCSWLADLRTIKSEGTQLLYEEEKILINGLCFVEAMNKVVNERTLIHRIFIVMKGVGSGAISMGHLLQAFFFAISPAFCARVLDWFVRNFIYRKRHERGI